MKWKKSWKSIVDRFKTIAIIKIQLWQYGIGLMDQLVTLLGRFYMVEKYMKILRIWQRLKTPEPGWTSKIWCLIRKNIWRETRNSMWAQTFRSEKQKESKWHFYEKAWSKSMGEVVCCFWMSSSGSYVRQCEPYRNWNAWRLLEYLAVPA